MGNENTKVDPLDAFYAIETEQKQHDTNLLLQIFNNIIQQPNNIYRTINLSLVKKQLKSQHSINLLYCAGFKKSSNGSHLVFDNSKSDDLTLIYGSLLSHKSTLSKVEKNEEYHKNKANQYLAKNGIGIQQIELLIHNNNTFPQHHNDGWKCPVCTFINNINFLYCEVCYCQKNHTHSQALTNIDIMMHQHPQFNEIRNTENEISDDQKVTLMIESDCRYDQMLEEKYQRDAHEIKQDDEFSLKLQKGLAKIIENKKRIIFIRHSQSTWNEAEKSFVNKTKSFTGGILESMHDTVENGGKYMDAPLSDYGIIQSTDLNTFIQHNYTQYQLKNILTRFHNKNSDKHIHKLQQLSSFNSNNAGNQFAFNISIDENNTSDKLIEKDILNLIGIHDHSNSSCVLTSNLRRSIDTAILGLSTRWQMFPNQKMYILSCLQEFGMGPDSFCKTKAKEVPKISEYTQQNKRINLKSFENFYSTRIDVSGNNGPKDILQKNNDKMLEFCRCVFKRKESTIIVVGHSHWFLTFFKTFLSQQNKNDKETSHISGLSKMYNGGCVGFDLCQIIKGRNDDYRIDGGTMVNVYKGFEKMNTTL